MHNECVDVDMQKHGFCVPSSYQCESVCAEKNLDGGSSCSRMKRRQNMHI